MQHSSGNLVVDNEDNLGYYLGCSGYQSTY